jgi:hypothetical protein
VSSDKILPLFSQQAIQQRLFLIELDELDELKSMTPTPTVAGSPAHNPRLRLWTASKVRGVSIIAQTS